MSQPATSLPKHHAKKLLNQRAGLLFREAIPHLTKIGPKKGDLIRYRVVFQDRFGDVSREFRKILFFHPKAGHLLDAHPQAAAGAEPFVIG